MAAKTVVVEASLGDKFKLESRIGRHTLYMDQPENSGGTDTGPTPLEYFLLSLAGCFSHIGRLVARQKRIPLRSMAVKIEGTLDPRVLQGKNTENRAGFSSLTVEVDVDANMTTKEKSAFLDEVKARCPVSDNILNVTPVSLQLMASGPAGEIG